MTVPALPVVFTRRAERQLEEAVAWWRANRPGAPNALIQELSRALDLIAFQPGIGAVTSNSKLAGVRRVLLEPVGYHVYYRVRPVMRRIDVLAFWHARRGTLPSL
jgi:plasmid stabilization system protein ParE